MQKQPKLIPKEKKALREYKNLLIKKFPKDVISITLFGSKARGDSNKESDLDTLITVEEKNPYLWNTIVDYSTDLLLKYENILISPKIRSKKELNQQSPFLENIKREGIELWNKKSKKNLLD